MKKFSLIGVDTGGTFIDFIAKDDKTGEFTITKTPATPDNPPKSVIEGLSILGAETKQLNYGTTVGLNAVLQRKGAKLALFTTQGFKDILLIGRQNRRDIYEINPKRPEPLVSKENRIGIPERVNSDGEIELPLEINEAKRILKESNLSRFDAFAICFLFSFYNKKHELAIKELLIKYGKPISTSHEIFPEYREYERTSTTVMDAYINPIVTDFIKSVSKAIIPRFTEKMVIMKSSTGLATISGILRKPLEILLSGLAGGILAAEYTCQLLHIKNAISIDIGGTSTDVAQIINGRANIKQEIRISGLPVGLDSIDIKTIGAGGGSIASNNSGFLKVGPESAAGKPGPVSYDKGGKNITVTDADLLFGVLGKKLAGGLILKPDLAKIEILKLAKELKLSLEEAIAGIRRVFHENIGGALRRVSTEEGYDPREFVIIAFGGAGPVHAVELAQLLSIKKVIIPPYPGIWSAFGLLVGDFRYDASQGFVRATYSFTEEEIAEIYLELKAKVIAMAKDDGIYSEENCKTTYTASMRYLGQSYDLPIKWIKESIKDLENSFIKEHRKVYGFASENEPIEIVALRIALTIKNNSVDLKKIGVKPEPQICGYRQVIGAGKVPFFEKKEFGNGSEILGPAIIDQSDTTIWIPEKWKGEVNQFGFLIISEVA